MSEYVFKLPDLGEGKYDYKTFVEEAYGGK